MTVRIVTLTPDEVRASDGHLCWRRRRNLHCSMPFDHVGRGTPCRFDMRIKTPTWTPARIRLALMDAAASLVVGAVIGWLVTR